MDCVSDSSDLGALCTFRLYHLSVCFEDMFSPVPKDKVEKTFLDCATITHTDNMMRKRSHFQIFVILLLSIQGLHHLKYIIMHRESEF